MDLVRALLLRIEEVCVDAGVFYFVYPDDDNISVEGSDQNQINYHIGQLADAGFIKANGGVGGHWNIGGLTWQGHEFLDAVRETATWQKTKEGAEKIGGWTIGLLVDLAKAYAKAEAKKRLGLDL